MWLSFFGGDIRKFLENCGVKKRKSVFLKPATKNQNNNEIIKSVIVFIT